MTDYSLNGSIIAVAGISSLEYKALEIKNAVVDFMVGNYGSYHSIYNNDRKIRTYSYIDEYNAKIQPFIDVFDKPEELSYCFKDRMMEEVVRKNIGISDKSSLILEIRSSVLFEFENHINAKEIIFDNYYMAREIFEISIILANLLRIRKNKFGLKNKSLVLLFDDEKHVYAPHEFRTSVTNLSIFKGRN